MKMKPSRASISLDKPLPCLPRRVPLPPHPCRKICVNLLQWRMCRPEAPETVVVFGHFWPEKFPHGSNFFQKLIAPNLLGPPGSRGLPASTDSTGARLPLPLTVLYSIGYMVAHAFTQSLHASTLPCFLLAPCLL